MRGPILITAIALTGLLAASLLWPRRFADGPAETTYTATPMRITSSAFADGERIPRIHTCDAEDVNPPLDFSEVPDGAATLALIAEDPDAPMGSWTHWTAWNIPPNATGIPYGASPRDAVEGLTSFGGRGYGGPCPPSGTHRYYFRLFALDTALDLGNDADIRALRAAMSGHILAEASLMGTYSREQ